MTAATTTCPHCEGDAVPIVFGLPTIDAFLSEERGEVVLGGCIVSGEDPLWECRRCHVRFGTSTDGRHD